MWYSILVQGGRSGRGQACQAKEQDVSTRYVYTSSLVEMSNCRAAPNEAGRIVVTPLRREEWEKELSRFPDREFVKFLLDGMAYGFRIGYKREVAPLVIANRNMLSAKANPAVVEDYLAKEVMLDRVVAVSAEAKVHVSRFGVIPKGSQPGKWRLIVDLSDPDGRSVNDGISGEGCSLSYVSVDDAARMVLRRGPGALLAKLDIESAYRIIPVHPDDRPLLGMRWKGVTYVDTNLPFGLRSAPKNFTALAYALSWVFVNRGDIRETIHYLDDYLFVGDPASEECAQALQRALALCEQLGVPIAREKVCQPSTSLTFLGIEVDTLAIELRLPQEKLERLKEAIYRVAGSEVMHKEGAPVASWPVTACLLRGQVRAYIPAQNDKSAVCGGQTASPYSPQ